MINLIILCTCLSWLCVSFKVESAETFKDVDRLIEEREEVC